MKKFINLALVLSIFLIIGNSYAAKHFMHPKFTLKAENGKAIINVKAKVSMEKTCTPCHDVSYINKHNAHTNKTVKASCVDCHFKGSKVSGNLKNVNQLVQKPKDENCAHCHGVLHSGKEKLSITDDYGKNIKFEKGKKYFSITLNTGEILSGQNISNSGLNIQGKSKKTFPWDAHIRRKVTCVSCHYTKNNPANLSTVKSDIDFLTKDPRKIKTLGTYLKWPNHDLTTAMCQECHDPLKAHKEMIFKKRHMEALECQSCHVPKVYGPALKSIDMTVVDISGNAKIEFRGIKEKQSHGDSINTKYISGYQPFLFPFKVDREKYSHKTVVKDKKIAPYNLVTHWHWIDSSKKQIPDKILKNIYLHGKQYQKDIVSIFDKNKDKKLDTFELRLDDSRKVNFIKSKLEDMGIKNPQIKGVIKAHRLNHGILSTKWMKRDCASCHNENSQLEDNIVLSGYSPGGIIPEYSTKNSAIIKGQLNKNEQGELVLLRSSVVDGHYVFGQGRIAWLDIAGFWIFVFTVLGVGTHGFFQYKARKALKHQAQPILEKIYLYDFYERIWHWVMGLGIVMMVFTGMNIHYPASFNLLGLQTAIEIHNIVGFIVLINAGLSLFYHLATGEIKQFFKFNRKYIHEIIIQLKYYGHGIFKGAAHPMEKLKERKLNALQQLTYLGLLTVLIPFQFITGLIIWTLGQYPGFFGSILDLSYLGPVHNFGAWIFLTFVSTHLYLITTGHTVSANLKAMVTGIDEVEKHVHDEEIERMKNMKVFELAKSIVKDIKSEKVNAK